MKNLYKLYKKLYKIVINYNREKSRKYSIINIIITIN